MLWAIVFTGSTPSGRGFSNVVGPYESEEMAKRHMNRAKYRIKRGYFSTVGEVKLQVRPMISVQSFTEDILT